MIKPRSCRNSQNNPSLNGNNKLARSATGALIEDSGTPIFIPATSWAYSPTLALVAPDLYTNTDLQRATKLALESFVKGQEYGQANSAF